MNCFYCGEVGSGTCTKCAKVYCREHGDGTDLCYRCRTSTDTFMPAVGIWLVSTVILGILAYKLSQLWVITTDSAICLPGLTFAVALAIAPILARSYRKHKREEKLLEWESAHPVRSDLATLGPSQEDSESGH